MVLIVPSHEVLKHGTTLLHFQFLSVLILVRQGWNAAIGVDLKEPWLLLLVFRHLDSTNLDKQKESCQY